MSNLIRPFQPVATRVRRVVNGRAWLTPNRKRIFYTPVSGQITVADGTTIVPAVIVLAGEPRPGDFFDVLVSGDVIAPSQAPFTVTTETTIAEVAAAWAAFMSGIDNFTASSVDNGDGTAQVEGLAFNLATTCNFSNLVVTPA